MTPRASFDPDLIVVAADRGGALNADPDDSEWLQKRSVITLDLRQTDDHPQWQHLTRPFTQTQVIEAAARLVKTCCSGVSN
ncbi:hypothetical protein KX928_06580 [Roseobacter sp. YSTF-M11]|uniref:Uncharacterized protein n=1 Tax=Roseobacter insulae TaxID=2859783 RepID=A0A9X1FTM2_9RHOB|nr:hypothetical protein [Roseobacter insulae]MBW4707448.1 hypothetical protein [Roseobacter insulae]